MFGALLKKELHDLVRQPRSLIAAILYPLLVFPLLAAVLAPQDDAASCLAVDAAVAADLAAQLHAATGLAPCGQDHESRLGVSVADGRAAIETGAWQGNAAALDTARSAIGAVMAQRTARAQGMAPDETRQVAAAAVVTQTAEADDGIGIIALVPIVVLFMAALGCAYPALESGVGEKETGTLLGLFQAPVSDATIIAAKFSATWLCACVAIMAGLAAATGIMAWQADPQTASGAVTVLAAVKTLAYAMLAAMPLAAAAIVVSLASQSLREGQQYLMILVCVAVLAGGGALIAFEAPWMAQIPVANVAGAIASELTGRAGASYTPALIMAANAGLAVLILLAGIGQLRRLRQAL